MKGSEQRGYVIRYGSFLPLWQWEGRGNSSLTEHSLFRRE